MMGIWLDREDNNVSDYRLFDMITSASYYRMFLIAQPQHFLCFENGMLIKCHHKVILILDNSLDLIYSFNKIV